MDILVATPGRLVELLLAGGTPTPHSPTLPVALPVALG